MPEALIGKFSLILFARYDFQAPALLDDAEIADILGKVDVLTSWAADVKAASNGSGGNWSKVAAIADIPMKPL